MNISRESKSAQNDILNIELTQSDYQEGFEKKLKRYAKEMTINGFRKGAAPIGMVKKMYGESILAEEINNLADKALQDYIQEQKLRLLGRPILAEGQEILDIKPNETKTYQIKFEIGYEPNYTINLDGNFSRYEIKTTSEMVDKEVENVKKYFTKLEDSADPVAEEDTLYFKFDNGQDIVGESFCSTTELTEEGKKQFIGKGLGNEVKGKPMDLFDNSKLDVKRYILNLKDITSEIETQVNGDISFEITNVKKRITPETLTPEQISQITRDETKTTMDDLRANLEADIKTQYDNLAQNYLRNDVYEFVSEHTQIDLPNDFLKRWIVSEKENNLTAEQVEKQFNAIEKSIKWDLITSKFAIDNNITVAPEEIKNEYKARYMQYFLQSGYTPPAEQLEQFANESMKDQKNVRKTYEQLMDTKVLDGMIGKIKVQSIPFTEEQFVAESKTRNEKAQAKQEEEHVHDEHCGHNH